MPYTTSALVTNWIGANYVAGDLAAADVTTFIARADGLIDTACGGKFYPFNSVTSTKTDGTTTYLTPHMIQLCSTHLAVSLALRQLRVQATNLSLKDAADHHWDQGIRLLNQLVTADFVMAPAVYLNETMDFGEATQYWTLDATQAFVGVASPMDSGDPPHIIESSVRIGSTATTTYGNVTAGQLREMRLGVEFDVTYHPGWQRYVLQANHEALWSPLTTLRVTWEWTYRRDRGSDRVFNGVFI